MAKPVVLNFAEWDESGRRIRAELMTLAPGTQISTDMVLRQHIDLGHQWWSELRSSLDALATFLTDRVCIDELLLQRRLLAAFGLPAAGCVHRAFADILDTPTGYIAQLAATAKLLGLVEHGMHPDLAVPLHCHTRHIIDAL